MTKPWLLGVAALTGSACLLETGPCEGGGVRVGGVCTCPEGTTQIDRACVRRCEPGFVARGQECQPVHACQEDERWDEALEACQPVHVCQEDERWDEALEACQPAHVCRQGERWDEALEACGCGPGERWDEALEACLKRASCADIACEAPRSCREADAQRDATCGCPAGEAWDEQRELCLGCGAEAPACDGAGASGAVLIADDARCVCETLDGYYLPPGGDTAAPCDRDSDGWLDERVQPVLEGTDALLRRNARCTPRRIGAFVLRNEAGREYSVDLSGQFALGLPLYESARNDGAPGAGAAPDYGSGGRAFEPRELDSLTKGCASASADFNDNGVADVREWSESVPEPERFADNPRLERYYAAYTRSGYFLELHDGHYETPAGSAPLGTYRIVERARRQDAQSQVAMKYAADLDYGRACARHPDALYSASSPNTIGGDYAQYGDFADMTHHSQFKCVQILSEFSYGPEPLEQAQPQLVYRRGKLLARRNAAGERLYDWTINDCRVSAESVPATEADAGPNPSYAPITCEVNATPAFDTVHWVAVGYEHYTAPYVDAASRGGYQRGCSNACIEQLYAPPRAADCLTCTTDAATGAGALQPDMNDVPQDDGNDCTRELCDGRDPVHPPQPVGTGCGAGGVCNGNNLCGVCMPDQTRCAPDGDGVQACGADGQWGVSTACAGDSTVCVAGACQPCAAGLRDCDELSVTLCEADIVNSPAHCGGCGLACSANGITPHCTAGVCDGACAPEPNLGFWLDCNGDKRTDGCELPTMFDVCVSCADCANATSTFGCEGNWCSWAVIGF